MAAIDNSPEACRQRHLAYLKSIGKTEAGFDAEQNAAIERRKAAALETQRANQERIRTNTLDRMREMQDRGQDHAQDLSTRLKSLGFLKFEIQTYAARYGREPATTNQERGGVAIMSMTDVQSEIRGLEHRLAHATQRAAAEHERRKREWEAGYETRLEGWRRENDARLEQQRIEREAKMTAEGTDDDKPRRVIPKEPSRRMRFDDERPPLMIFPDGTFGTLRDMGKDRHKD